MQNQDIDIQTDMEVFDRDGRRLGTVNKIIFESYREEVRALVVAAGPPWTPKHVMPMEHATGSQPLALETDLSTREFAGLPRFREQDFRHPPGSWAPPHGWLPGQKY